MRLKWKVHLVVGGLRAAIFNPPHVTRLQTESTMPVVPMTLGDVWRGGAELGGRKVSFHGTKFPSSLRFVQAASLILQESLFAFCRVLKTFHGSRSNSFTHPSTWRGNPWVTIIPTLRLVHDWFNYLWFCNSLSFALDEWGWWGQTLSHNK